MRDGKVEGEKDLWSVDGFDLKTVVRNEYTRRWALEEYAEV
jgi:hypothetical protein